MYTVNITLLASSMSSAFKSPSLSFLGQNRFTLVMFRKLEQQCTKYSDNLNITGIAIDKPVLKILFFGRCTCMFSTLSLYFL